MKWQWTADNAGPEDEWGCRTRGPIDIGVYESGGGYCHNPELYDEEGNEVLSAGGGEYDPLPYGDNHAAIGYLIEAAPEMLRVLKVLVEQEGSDEPCERSVFDAWFEDVKSVIAKAERKVL